MSRLVSLVCVAALAAASSAQTVKLNGPLAHSSAGSVQGFATGASGARVAYLVHATDTGLLRLDAAPLDGSAPPVELSPGTSSPGNDVGRSFAVAPDGSRVAFTMGLALHVAPLDGSSLHPALPAGRGVTAYLAAPGGARVVYLADADTDERFELFSVPTAGGAAPVKLNGTLVAGGDVGRYLRIGCAVSPDGACVAYVADQDVDERFELYSVPIDGSAPAVKVSGTMIPGGDVGTDDVTPTAVANHLEITPDSRHVVFLADREVDGTNELWLAPLDASAPPRRLSGLPGSRSILSFALDRHGYRALYRTHEHGDLTRRELFAVPLDGSAPAEPMTSGPSGVQAYAHASHPMRALFLADQDTDGVVELFSTRLRRGPRPSDPPQ